jgi:tetratricopeptide (TPR) repeat protein
MRGFEKMGRLGAWAGVLLCIAMGNSYAASDIQAILAEVDTALTKGDSVNAERLVGEALGEQGVTAAEESQLLSDRALAYELDGRREEALADYTKAIEMHALPRADQIRALLERGLTLDAMNKLGEAISNYTAALKLDPHFAIALNNRANAYRRLNRRVEARRDYIASLAAGNIQAEYPYYGLGQISEAQGDNAAARGYYAYALAANPKFTLAAERLSVLGGAPDEAVVAPVLLRPPEPATAPENIGVVQHPPKWNFIQHKSHSELRPSLAADSSNGYIAQLGAWRTEEQAAGGWVRAVRLAANLLGDASPSILPVELSNKGRFYRLRVKPMGNAVTFCASLKMKGLDCEPVKE